ncbi:MAG TPA: pilus assembly protein TadG-related protein [Acidobacteriaceae bacterium]|nr:pilus assembly protein TadG-related protein [Acidobacteriaceae bacterium]
MRSTNSEDIQSVTASAHALPSCGESTHAALQDREAAMLEPWHGEAGQTTVFMVLFMATFLIGFVALGIDVESLFQGKRQAQAAADAAVVAYAEESGNGATTQQAAANAMVKLNGVNTTPVINTPPTTGNYTTGSTTYYEAVVSVPVSMFFAPLITHHSTITVKARAVAGAGLTSPSCICLEGTTGNDLNLSNNAKLSPTGCGTMVDSSSSNAVSIVGGATLGGLAIGSVSTNWDTASNVNNGGSVASGTKVVEGVATSCAPPLPAVPSYSAAACTPDPLGSYSNGGTSYSVGPGSLHSTLQTGNLVCYNSLTIGSNGDTVNLNPGTYVIRGGSLHFLSATATGGSGVFFYLTNGASLTVDNGANVTLSAASSGTYAGTLVYQDTSDTQAMSVQGGANTNLSGAIYAPSANVTFGNGSGNMFDDLTAKTLTMNGGSLASNASTNFGNLNISTAKLGE